eukprot:scaffold645_cov247-Pinguiococcus_pyrenoidosus.AAC.35
MHGRFLVAPEASRDLQVVHNDNGFVAFASKLLADGKRCMANADCLRPRPLGVFLQHERLSECVNVHLGRLETLGDEVLASNGMTDVGETGAMPAEAIRSIVIHTAAEGRRISRPLPLRLLDATPHSLLLRPDDVDIAKCFRKAVHIVRVDGIPGDVADGSIDHLHMPLVLLLLSRMKQDARRLA